MPEEISEEDDSDDLDSENDEEFLKDFFEDAE